MADYYPLIAKAVQGPAGKAIEGRQAVYSRARKALTEQLGKSQSGFSERQILAELGALDDAIARVENLWSTVGEPTTSSPLEHGATVERVVGASNTMDAPASLNSVSATSANASEVGEPITQVVPVSLNRHRGKGWIKPRDFKHAATQWLVPLAAAEVGPAAVALPLVLAPQNKGWTLCALLGLRRGESLCVSADGVWTARYTPALLRTYPFSVASDPSGALLLCVDEAQVATGSGVEPLFDMAGAASAGINQTSELLRQIATGIAVLRTAVKALVEANVVEPWPIAVGGEQLDGLFRVNETTLNSAGPETFLRLRAAGALAVGYAQLLSMANTTVLTHAFQSREESTLPPSSILPQKPPSLDLALDGTINWDWGIFDTGL